jgi:hypothetical protein
MKKEAHMTYQNKNLTLPLAFVFDEHYQQLSASSKYAYAVLQEISDWKQIRHGYFPVESRPFSINRSYLQELLPHTSAPEILKELVAFQLASVQKKSEDAWVLQLLPVKCNRPQDNFLEEFVDGNTVSLTFKQQVERLKMPLYIQQVLMEHQQRLVKENISPLEIDEHFFKHKEIVPIATYAAKLNKALKTKGTIVSISDILDNELNLKK